MHVTSTTRNRNNDDSTKNEECILDWLFSCWDPQTGGFGGNTGQNGHMLYTLSALQILALAGNSLETDSRLDRDRVIEFILALQQPDGSWAGDKWGEIDFLVHSIAFAGKDELQGSMVANTTREGFRRAMDISVYSFIDCSRRASELMKL